VRIEGVELAALAELAGRYLRLLRLTHGGGGHFAAALASLEGDDPAGWPEGEMHDAMRSQWRRHCREADAAEAQAEAPAAPRRLAPRRHY
jgi:hypothetical protein